MRRNPPPSFHFMRGFSWRRVLVVTLILAGMIQARLLGVSWRVLLPVTSIVAGFSLMIFLFHGGGIWHRLTRTWTEVPPQVLPQVFGARQKKLNRVFVVPRGASVLLGGVSVLLFLQGLLFDQPIGMLLGLMGVVLCALALFDCHLGLAGLRIESAWSDDGVVGRAQTLWVGLRDLDGRRRPGLFLQVVGASLGGFFEVAPQSFSQQGIEWTPMRRGAQPWPLMRLHTTLPFGLFHSWIQFRPAGQIYIAPAPEVSPPPIPSATRRGNGAASRPRAGQGMEWMGLKQHRPEEGIGRVAWKESARRQRLLTKVHEQEQSQEVWVDFAQTSGLPYEERLSRLAGWLLLAHQQNLAYGLLLPGQTLGPGRGEAHYKECQRALALMPLEAL